MEQVQAWATSGSSDSLVNLGDNVTSPKNKTPKQVEAHGTSGSTWKKLMAKKTFFTKKRKHFFWAKNRGLDLRHPKNIFFAMGPCGKQATYFFGFFLLFFLFCLDKKCHHHH